MVGIIRLHPVSFHFIGVMSEPPRSGLSTVPFRPPVFTRFYEVSSVAKYAKLMNEPVPQSEALDSSQVQNNARGFVYQLDDWGRLDRFLVLGSDSGTYYQSAKKLTKENAACVVRCYDIDYTRTVARIVEISDQGRAPKNDAAIFALAIGACHKDVRVRQAALRELPKVCRIGTHLFQFVDCCRSLGRGWGSALMRAVASWYEHRSPASLAYQVIKYRNRENYSHKRLLQTSHPGRGERGKKTGIDPAEAQRKALYRWICNKEYDADQLPSLVQAHIEAMKPETSKSDRLGLILGHGLPWEALPTECNKDPDIWRAMLPDMGMTALIRNLGGMTQLGTLKPLSDEVQIVIQRLKDEDQLKKARIHPFNMLTALAVYRQGHGVKGSRAWDPIENITDALEEAFYKSFKFVEPTGKRTMICLDVSGSMSSPLMGSPLEVCEGAAAMAMVTMRAESNWHVMGFTDRLRDLNLTAKMSLPEVLKRTRNQTFGGTNCALPMIYAIEKGLSVDVFQVYTDNETWAGSMHPSQALRNYRKKTGIPAKLVVTGMTSTSFTIADPKDGGMLDVIGFDSSAPAIIADFARG